MSDASIDSSGQAAVVVAFFYDNGSIQFIYFTSMVAETIFQAGATVMDVTLKES
jgi:hypothetical protein